MRKVFIIGIGAGNSEYMTVQAINALNEVDVFFMMVKGREKENVGGLGAGSKFFARRPDEFGSTKMRSAQAHGGL